MATLTADVGARAEQEARVREDQAPVRVCFVCTGNTCRSPMAEAAASFYANTLKRSAECPAMLFRSAGLYAHTGEPIAQNAVRALERANIEPSAARDFHQHRAHTLTEEEAECYDLLVGMSSGHAMELLLRFPALASRITVLSPPVSDPYGGDLACYEAALRDILTGVRAMFFPQAEERI